MEFLYFILLTPLTVSFIMSVFLFRKYLNTFEETTNEHLFYTDDSITRAYSNDQNSETVFESTKTIKTKNPARETHHLSETEKESFNQIMNQLNPYD